MERELKVDAWDEADEEEDDYEHIRNRQRLVPFLRELKTWTGLKEAELYYTSLNMQLNRARMCNLFPSQRSHNRYGFSGEFKQEHEALPC